MLWREPHQRHLAAKAMSTRKNFPRTALRLVSRFAARLLAAFVTLASAAALPGVGNVARADELVLAGPHPALKENALSLQFLFGAGLSDSWSGRGLGIGYGYMLHGPLWLDLQMNLRASACGAFLAASCGTHTGNDAELMAGVAWRFRTDIPVVPILRGGVGLIYLYPNGAQSAIGLGARAGAGIKYYLYDWLGFGVEAALSLGHGYLGQDYAGGHTYAVADMGIGVEYQFQ
jgi:hypothetical protein